MKKQISLLIFLFAFCIRTLSAAQPREGSGKVTVNEDDAPLTDVSQGKDIILAGLTRLKTLK